MTRHRLLAGSVSLAFALAGASSVPAAAALGRPARMQAATTPAQACDLFATVAATAATIQQTVQTQTGQHLPADLAATINQIGAQAGCGTSGTGPASPAPTTPAQACDLFATVAATAATIQQTVQTQTGQHLPADLAATINQIGAQAGCGTSGTQPSPTTTAPSGDASHSSGSDSSSASSSPTGSGSGNGTSGGTVVGGAAYQGQLPRTGGSALRYELLGGGTLGLAGLLELLRRRLAVAPQ